METDRDDDDHQPDREKPSDDQDQDQDQDQDEGAAATSQTRSYECTFCKRGFSNAQALGGHMNIHRKDKARLKHSSNTTETHHHHLEPPNFQYISDVNPSLFPPNYVEMKKSGDNTSSIRWSKWVLDHPAGKPDIGANKIKQLALFVDKSSREDDQEMTPATGLSLGHGTSSSDETLDLELRLGHEPQNSPSPPPAPTSTKKFF